MRVHTIHPSRVLDVTFGAVNGELRKLLDKELKGGAGKGNSFSPGLSNTSTQDTVRIILDELGLSDRVISSSASSKLDEFITNVTKMHRMAKHATQSLQEGTKKMKKQINRATQLLEKLGKCETNSLTLLQSNEKKMSLLGSSWNEGYEKTAETWMSGLKALDGVLDETSVQTMSEIDEMDLRRLVRFISSSSIAGNTLTKTLNDILKTSLKLVKKLLITANEQKRKATGSLSKSKVEALTRESDKLIESQRETINSLKKEISYLKEQLNNNGNEENNDKHMISTGTSPVVLTKYNEPKQQQQQQSEEEYKKLIKMYEAEIEMLKLARICGTKREARVEQYEKCLSQLYKMVETNKKNLGLTAQRRNPLLSPCAPVRFLEDTDSIDFDNTDTGVFCDTLISDVELLLSRQNYCDKSPKVSSPLRPTKRRPEEHHLSPPHVETVKITKTETHMHTHMHNTFSFADEHAHVNEVFVSTVDSRKVPTPIPPIQPIQPTLPSEDRSPTVDELLLKYSKAPAVKRRASPSVTENNKDMFAWREQTSTSSASAGETEERETAELLRKIPDSSKTALESSRNEQGQMSVFDLIDSNLKDLDSHITNILKDNALKDKRQETQQQHREQYKERIPLSQQPSPNNVDINATSVASVVSVAAKQCSSALVYESPRRNNKQSPLDVFRGTVSALNVLGVLFLNEVKMVNRRIQLSARDDRASDTVQKTRSTNSRHEERQERKRSPLRNIKEIAKRYEHLNRMTEHIEQTPEERHVIDEREREKYHIVDFDDDNEDDRPPQDTDNKHNNKDNEHNKDNKEEEESDRLHLSRVDIVGMDFQAFLDGDLDV